ncbi:hypothetical protein [Clostridium hydrogeniformans]|uniref:hypothetical protein n=1 Tax=Clostridium hydrogeniformans TaxID=349933 RepID=UPI0004837E98|nr:hypothetical protein [Clostridium hydrogeniformans]
MKFINKHINSYRIIKLLYTFFIASFMFALEISIVSPMFKVRVGYKDLLILILLGLLIQVATIKEIKTKVYFPIIIILELLYSYLFYSFNRPVNNMILIFTFLIVYLLIYISLDESAIYHEYYKRLGIKTSIILLSLIVSYIFIDDYNKNILGKVYIIYILSYISLLRASRKVFFKVYTMKDGKINLALLVGSMSIFLPWTNSLIYSLKTIYEAIMEPIVVLVANILYYIIGYPLMKITRGGGNKAVEFNNFSNLEKFEGNYREDLYYKEFKIIAYIIYGITLVLFIYMAFRILKRIRIKKTIKDEFMEEREKISIKKDKKIFNMYRELRNKDNREKIYYYYRSFLKKAKEKDLYKPHMTARQVYGKVRGEIRGKDKELLDLKDIYNKAKFSSEEVTSEMTSAVENAYKSVDRTLK